MCLLVAATVATGSLLHAFGTLASSDSVFASKTNPLNTVFAKYAWGWTSLPLLLFMILHASSSLSSGSTSSNTITTNAIRNAAARWIGATLYWALLTQWALGNPLLDRVLLATGDCRIPSSSSSTISANAFSIRQCKSMGGSLTGLDISGHCFLLVHAILLISEELRPYFSLHFDTSHSATTSIHSRTASHASRMVMSILAVILVTLAVIWWMMLLATCIYFHSFAETFPGTLLGMLYWAVLYVASARIYPDLLPVDFNNMDDHAAPLVDIAAVPHPKSKKRS
ncbi:hypothetical protein BSLG_009538 [Batrachochytrium salamandrivorans]|nr:hypothetical protein BSLG_009538 [Batrachochytrium salamandrivorans]